MDANFIRIIFTLVNGFVGLAGIVLAIDSFNDGDFFLGVLELLVGIFFCILASFIYLSPIIIIH